MFGYLKPDLPYLYLKDDKLYKSLYCGVCKSIGKTCGEMARMSLTYDVAFLSAVAHNILGKDVEIKNKRCALHWIKPRPVASKDDLTVLLANVNVLLAYYKIEDDILDNNRGRTKRLFVMRGYKRAKKAFPEVDQIIKLSYNELRKLEKNEENVLDRVCEPFSDMMRKLSVRILENFSTFESEQLFYFIGKWIYLIDALDDYDKDLKQKNFNPLYSPYKAESAKDLLKNFGKEISFVFNDVLQNITFYFSKIECKFNKDLISNIILRGIPGQTQTIFKRITGNE